MYNYTKNIYKAVKCTLKTQIKGFWEYCTDRNDRKRPEAIIVYYRRGAMVYGCTTPLIHGVKGDGCLFEKFFLIFFYPSLSIFLEKFFLEFFIFFLQMMAGMYIFVVH